MGEIPIRTEDGEPIGFRNFNPLDMNMWELPETLSEIHSDFASTPIQKPINTRNRTSLIAISMHECSQSCHPKTTEMFKKLLLVVGSALFPWIKHNPVELEKIYSKIKRFLLHGSPGDCLVEGCKSCKKQIPPVGALTADDIEMVVEKLGMGRLCKETDMPLEALEGVSHLLEEKEASLEELRDAFAVFDQDGDGFISVIELQQVMCKLELAEGMNLEDCEKMIKAADRNGDGRIDFSEFKDMLEHVC